MTSAARRAVAKNFMVKLGLLVMQGFGGFDVRFDGRMAGWWVGSIYASNGCLDDLKIEIFLDVAVVPRYVTSYSSGG